MSQRTEATALVGRIAEALNDPFTEVEQLEHLLALSCRELAYVAHIPCPISIPADEEEDEVVGQADGDGGEHRSSVA